MTTETAWTPARFYYFAGHVCMDRAPITGLTLEAGAYNEKTGDEAQ